MTTVPVLYHMPISIFFSVASFQKACHTYKFLFNLIHSAIQ